MELYTDQMAQDVNGDLTLINNLSKTIFYNAELFEYLQHSGRYETFDKINFKLEIDKMLYSFVVQTPSIFGITIVTNHKDIHAIGYAQEAIIPELLYQQTWYKDILNSNGEMIITTAHDLPYVDINEHITTITIGRLLITPDGKVGGVLLFDIKPDNLVHSRFKTDFIYAYDAQAVIKNPKGYLYNSDATSDKVPSKDLSNYIFIKKYLDIFDIEVSTYISKDTLYKENKRMLAITLSIVLVSVLLITFLSFYWSGHLSKPIISLTNVMNRIDSGSYESIEDDGRRDEIGILTNAYNKMVLRIKTLIEDVYVARLNKKEAELAALQTQINPHMLYNTLESIRMKAAINHDKEVANMIKILGKMFRLSLNRTQNINYIFDEINYIDTYIDLQNIRYENRFSLVLDVPDEVMNAQIISLVFQPIIENSINHGFKDKKENCIISIQGRIAHNIITIKIHDNGSGMCQEKLDALNKHLHDDQVLAKGSIGIKNVTSRLRLHYGTNFDIYYESEPLLGTTVTLMIPHI